MTQSNVILTSEMVKQEIVIIDEFSNVLIASIIRSVFNPTRSKLKLVPVKSSSIPYDGDPKRIFIIVNIINLDNNENRKGADCDRDNLIRLFTKLGYTIFYFEDLTREQFIDLKEELIASGWLKDVDSFMIFVGSHGCTVEGVSMIEFKDGEPLSTESIIQMFSGNSCEPLRRKEKVMIFNCCRGDIADATPKSVAKLKLDSLTDKAKNISSTGCVHTGDSNTLVIYSTCLRHYSFRHPEMGSHFVSEFCKIVSDKAWNTEFGEIMKILPNRVQLRVKKQNINFEGVGGQPLQIPVVENRGFGKLHHHQTKKSK